MDPRLSDLQRDRAHAREIRLVDGSTTMISTAARNKMTISGLFS